MLTTNQIKRLRGRFSRLIILDYILLCIIFGISVLWAAVFNSIDNPMENQPLDFIIDISRIISQPVDFIGYFFQTLTIYMSGYLIYWVNHRILINLIMSKFGAFKYLLLTAVFISVVVPLLCQLALTLPINSSPFTLLPSGNHNPFDYWNYFMAVLIIISSTPIILSFKWLTQKAELSELKQEKIQTELRWLQQQINPHFLFNTLNNLYSLTLAKSDLAPTLILQLSDLLRFVVYEGGKDKVSLHDEIQYLTNYIELQSIRVNHRTQLSFIIAEEVKEKAHNLSISPLLIVIIIENAFKHGVDKTDKTSWVNLEISLIGTQLKIKCSNSVDLVSAIVKDNQAHGVGLDNLRRRLELLYPEKHNLLVTDKGEEFHILLTLELNEHDKA